MTCDIHFVQICHDGKRIIPESDDAAEEQSYHFVFARFNGAAVAQFIGYRRWKHRIQQPFQNRKKI